MSGKRKPSFTDKDNSIHDVRDTIIDDDDDSIEASDRVGNLSAASASYQNVVDTALKNERTFSSSSMSTTTSTSLSEHDVDYESVSSPGNSSTASGPTYIRDKAIKLSCYN